ncbi:MAG: ATP-binding cassette domain-containing protein [Candidatus Malihini olakiniferum]
MSSGEQQRASLAQALMSELQLMLLDEPFSSLNWLVGLRL